MACAWMERSRLTQFLVYRLLWRLLLTLSWLTIIIDGYH